MDNWFKKLLLLVPVLEQKIKVPGPGSYNERNEFIQKRNPNIKFIK